MQQFIATVTPGSEILAARWLGDTRGVTVTGTESGFLTFETALPWSKFQNVRYLSNCFLVLSSGRTAQEGKKVLSDLLTRKFPITSTVKEVVRSKKTFRIVCAIENEMVAPPREAVAVTESKIIRALRLGLSIKAPSIEFWMMVRRDGRYYFVLRISALRRENKERAAGELRSEVANIMVRLSKPRAEDIVYDPFCGLGSLLLERGYYAPYAQLIGSDNDERLVREARKKLGGLQRVTVSVEDSLHSTLKSDSVSSILTDPPWGFFDAKINTHEFYRAMLAEFARILRSGKRVVLVTGAKEAMQDALLESTFTVIEKYDVLISGKKATIYVLKKN